VASSAHYEAADLVNSFNNMVRSLENSRKNILKTEKISIWQTMAQQLAHEIKNPLTPIKLTTERVLRRIQNGTETDPQLIENSMLSILQEIDSLIMLLDDFKIISRPIEASSGTTVVREALEELIAIYKVSYPSITIDAAAVANAALVHMGRRHLLQVLTNILINAIDAMSGSGTIFVRTDIIAKQGMRFCRISIKDSGGGMTEEEAQKILDPYFTTKETGTGLGLSIVERIVNDYGGALLFNTALGAGSTFFIDIPC
jgi:nitrogen fixation/metabolism regulation signal transduction histidine kinase